MIDIFKSTINMICASVGILFSLVAWSTAVIYKRRGSQWEGLGEWQTLFLVHALALLCDILSYSFEGRLTSSAIMLKQIGDCGEFLLNFLLLSIFTAALCRRIGDEKFVLIWRGMVYLISLIYLILVTSNFFTGAVFYIDTANIYHRGPYFWQAQLLALVLETGNLFLLLYFRKKLQRAAFLTFMLFVIAPGIGSILQLFWYGISFSYTAITIALIVLFFVIQFDAMNDMIRQEQEISKLKKLRVADNLQPQFLYDSLGSIAEIRGTPEKTKEALMDFSRYLRGNVEILEKKDLIPFSAELNHIRTYAKLEQLRFEDKLNMRYQIATTDFMVPALSIQMMVENAIKHGITNKEGPGSVVLDVRENNEKVCIVIADDGVGFDPTETPDDGRVHVGLNNAKERLEMLAGGTLDIHSKIGFGTTVEISIPKGGSER